MKGKAAEASADRIAGAARSILSAMESTGEWSVQSLDALRRLVRARQAALLVSTEEQHRVFGDEGAAAVLRRVPADARLHAPLGVATLDGASSWCRVPSATARPEPAVAAARAPEVVTPAAPPGAAGVDRLGMLGPLDDRLALVGVCFTFPRPLSRHASARRMALLRAARPLLEAAVRHRLASRTAERALRTALSSIDTGAALFTREGVLRYANPPLERMLGSGGEGGQLRWWMAQAASTAERRRAGQVYAPDATLAVRYRPPRHRLRSYPLPAPPGGGAADVLVLVEPLAVPAESALLPGDATLLRERFRITDRECDVVRLLHLGYSNAEVAVSLAISPNTARHHTERVMMKLGVRSRAAIHRVLMESRNGIPESTVGLAPAVVPHDVRSPGSVATPTVPADAARRLTPSDLRYEPPARAR